MSLDGRLRAATGEATSAALEGLWPASRYRPTERLYGGVGAAPIRRRPTAEAEQIDELLFGEAFDALEHQDGFVFGQAARDGYVGWMCRRSLAAAGPTPTHRVAALSSIALAAPSVKSPRLLVLPLNALVCVETVENGFAALRSGGWAPERHLQSIGRFEDDPAEIALRHLGVPYLWGGRTPAGVDCSGLVQAAFYACGRACPRDSDQQQALGCEVPVSEARRNDLVFWLGHVGLMLDERRLVHANAHAMSVAIEPLEAARDRIARSGGGRSWVVRP